MDYPAPNASAGSALSSGLTPNEAISERNNTYRDTYSTLKAKQTEQKTGISIHPVIKKK